MLSFLGSTTTPPLAPPKGMPTAAHFQVIHMASALTSLRVTPWWYRIPPLAGPRAKLCWTRYPSNMRNDPSSIFTGKATISWRWASRRKARTPGFRPRRSAAASYCRCALSQGSSTASAAIASVDWATVLTSCDDRGASAWDVSCG